MEFCYGMKVNNIPDAVTITMIVVKYNKFKLIVLAISYNLHVEEALNIQNGIRLELAEYCEIKYGNGFCLRYGQIMLLLRGVEHATNVLSESVTINRLIDNAENCTYDAFEKLITGCFTLSHL